MQRKVVAKSVLIILAVCLSVTAAQASNFDGSTSLLNPWNPATMAVETAVDRTLTAGDRMPHAGSFDAFSSWSLFADYGTGKTKDKRQGGFDNYFNSYTVGADALYNNTTLWGFMGNLNDAQGHSKTGNRDQVDSGTYSLYTSQPVNEWMYWGTSFSYGTSENKIRGNAGDTDSENYVVAPYLTMMKQMEKLNLSISPSYVLGYQEVDYPAGVDDTALMGKLVLMGRAAYTFTEKMSVALNLNYNQILHNHALDTEFDNDHRWFTTGAKLNYKFTSNLNGSVGYSTDIDSNFDSDIWNVGLAYAF
jgi:hypothetical protein